MISYFKCYYKVKIISSVWNWQKKKQINHWLSIDSLEIDPYKPRQFFDYLLTVYSTNGAEITGYPIAKTKKNKKKQKTNKNTPKEPRYIPHAAAKSLQLCPTLCDPTDGSPLSSPVPGILHARTLEWVAISFSNAWKWKVKVKTLSCIRPSATPWTAAFQAPPSMGFSRQEYWSGVPLPSPIYCIVFSKLKFTWNGLWT